MAVTVLGIDCPPVIGSAAAIQPHAQARLDLRVPPGMDPVEAQDALVATWRRPRRGGAGRGRAGGLRLTAHPALQLHRAHLRRDPPARQGHRPVAWRALHLS
jgi:hypothetical protein